jgi:hypothetical protein
VTHRGIPPHLLAGPIAKQVYRPMRLWCDVGGHIDPKTFACDRCALRVCARHSRWWSHPHPARHERLCDDCSRKEDHRDR